MYIFLNLCYVLLICGTIKQVVYRNGYKSGNLDAPTARKIQFKKKMLQKVELLTPKAFEGKA